MSFTIAEARNDRNASMHCIRGHRFTLRTSHRDDYGTWCRECGNDAHSYDRAGCESCARHDGDPAECHRHCVHARVAT